MTSAVEDIANARPVTPALTHWAHPANKHVGGGATGETEEPSNRIGEEQDNYGAECNRRHNEPRLS